ncbi:MAG: RNA polymerase sigma factor [Nannocystaceae bacterium]
MTATSATRLPHESELDARFAEVFHRHFDSVWTHLRRLGVPAADLDDAVQETFLVAFRRWDDFRTDASWRAWLLGISRRVAAHHRRGSGRRLRLVARARDQPQPQDVTDPHDALARRHAADLVERFIERLPPRKREVFVLAEIEGLSGAEIAQALSINPNTVWSRLHGAREAFDRHLQTLHAREHGALQRLDRASVLRRHQATPAPERSRRHVLAALGVQLSPASSTPPAVSAPLAQWWLMLKPVAIAVALGTAAVLGVAGLAQLARSPHAPPTLDPPRAARESSPEPSASAPTVREPPASASVAAAPALPRLEGPAAETPLVRLVEDPPAVVTSPPVSGPRPLDSDPAPPAPPTAQRLSEETALLHSMRRAALAGDHEQALRLSEQHARTFTDGVLAPDRQALRITALCALGRTEQAAAEATRWSTQHPQPPLPAAVRRGCPSIEQKPTKPAGPGQQP